MDVLVNADNSDDQNTNDGDEDEASKGAVQPHQTILNDPSSMESASAVGELLLPSQLDLETNNQGDELSGADEGLYILVYIIFRAVDCDFGKFSKHPRLRVVHCAKV